MRLLLYADTLQQTSKHFYCRAVSSLHDEAVLVKIISPLDTRLPLTARRSTSICAAISRLDNPSFTFERRYTMIKTYDCKYSLICPFARSTDVLSGIITYSGIAPMLYVWRVAPTPSTLIDSTFQPLKSLSCIFINDAIVS